MFAPNKTWRRWHRKVNINQKRYAIASALAASAVPALVLARGHKIEKVAEVPLVLHDEVEGLERTKDAVKILKNIGAYDDVLKAKDSRNLRAGKGKLRNRRYVSRKGPLVVYGTEGAKIAKAFRNIPGVEVASVERLNLLQLAPGGHLGRFVIWTQSAFAKLDTLYGTHDQPSTAKKGYKLPRSIMANSDLTRIINSDEIQSIVKAPKKELKRRPLKKNPLKNLGALLKLNPFAKTARRLELLASAQQAKSRAEKLTAKRTSGASKEEVKKAGEVHYKTMISDSDYTEFDVFQKWLGVSQ